MSTFDVREQNYETIEEVVFADEEGPGGSFQAYKLTPWVSDNVRVCDASGDFVYVNSKEHASNLIKALEKVIELGWLK